MISNAETNEIFSGLRKAAIAIVTLGDEVAAEVFRYLNAPADDRSCSVAPQQHFRRRHADGLTARRPR